MIRIGAVVALLAGPCAAQEVWRVVYNDLSPFSSTTPDGDVGGYSIELMREVARRSDATLEFIRTGNPGEGLALIERGEADIHVHLADRPDRRSIVAFSAPYATATLQLYRATQRTDLSPDALAGVRIGSINGSMSAAVIRRLHPEAELVTFDNRLSGMYGLLGGEIDYLFTVNESFVPLIRLLGIDQLLVADGSPLVSTGVSFAVDVQQPALVSKIDSTLADVLRDPAHDALYAQHFGSGTEGAEPGEVLRAFFWGLAIASAISALIAAALVMRTALKREQAQQKLRMAELTVQTNRELKTQANSLRELLYVVSHDLHSPLVSIAGFVDMVREDITDGRAKTALDVLDRVDVNIAHMRRLLYGLSKLRGLDLDSSEHARFDSGPMIKELRTVLASELSDRQAVLIEPKDSVSVLGDRALIQRALQNLISNALRHASRQPGDEVEIRVHRVGSLVRFGVLDRGPGVPKRFQSRIFELNLKLDRSSDGMGLGLAIVRRVAEIHMGTTWVEDRPDGGAAFWLTVDEAALSSSADRRRMMGDAA